MNVGELQQKFQRMGARIAVQEFRSDSDGFEAARINIRKDRFGEYFTLDVNPNRFVSAEVLDIRPEDRHLLLMIRQHIVGTVSERTSKQKFLCGHDERAWFVAAVPEEAFASSVPGAMEALKPEAVRQAEARVQLRGKERNRRRNRAFVRQGEWFFIPRPNISVNPNLVIRNEQLRRGLGKPHFAEFCFRDGGEAVYVSHLFPNGLTERQYKNWRDENPKRAREVRWTPMRRDARVYVRGRIRHPDHKTIVLQDWHEVQMNTETRAVAMRHVAFLD